MAENFNQIKSVVSIRNYAVGRHFKLEALED
jgi:hypothetical protein